MKTFCLSLMMLTGSVGFALAVLPGQSIRFDGGGAETVVFRSETHRQPCSACHNKELFPRMQKGATPITMAAIDSGQRCGACHNGSQAFASQDNCRRCHQGYQEK